MLPKSFRIPKQVFSSLFKGGTRRSTPYFQCISKKNTESHSRLGIIIGKRVAKSAVNRNKIKRMLRTGFQSFQQTIHPPQDILCIVKQDCSKEPLQAIKQQMQIVTNQQ